MVFVSRLCVLQAAAEHAAAVGLTGSRKSREQVDDGAVGNLEAVRKL